MQCTQAAPCRLSTVIASLVPGDVVLLEAGTYDASAGSMDRIVLDKYHPIAATPQTPVVFRSVPGDKAVLAGNQKDNCVWIDGTPNVIVEGLEIQGCWEAGVRAGEDAQDKTQGLVVRNNEFHDIVCNDNMGAVMVNGVQGLVFENNVVHHFSKNGTKGGGMVLFRAVDTTVQNNEFYDLDQGIYFKHGEAVSGAGGFARFYGNYFHDMPGFALGVNQNRTEIAYDIFKDTGGLMLFQADGTVADFLFDVHVHHDTFVRSDVAPMQRSDGFSGAQNVHVDHCIFLDGKLDVWRYGLDADYDAGIGFQSDQSCFFVTSGQVELDYFASSNPAYGPKGGAYSFADWQALGFDKASLVVDPSLDPMTFHAAAPACAAFGAYGP